MTTAKLASRHYCPAADSTGISTFHSRGNGKPHGVGKCKYCRSDLTVVTGFWGVFRWTGNGRYPLDAAMSTHLSEQAADRAQVKAYEAARAEFGYGSDETNVVVRWIYA